MNRSRVGVLVLVCVGKRPLRPSIKETRLAADDFFLHFCPSHFREFPIFLIRKAL